MACNCGQPSVCNNCANGVSCGCPPDYSMTPVLPDCGCCPDGYTWSGPTANYPNGVCTNGAGGTIEPIDCEPCEESVSDKCVFMTPGGCFGFSEGTTLQQFAEYLCSVAFTRHILSNISTDQQSYNGLCNLVAGCGIPGSTTPVIGPISWEIP